MDRESLKKNKHPINKKSLEKNLRRRHGEPLVLDLPDDCKAPIVRIFGISGGFVYNFLRDCSIWCTKDEKALEVAAKWLKLLGPHGFVVWIYPDGVIVPLDSQGWPYLDPEYLEALEYGDWETLELLRRAYRGEYEYEEESS